MDLPLYEQDRAGRRLTASAALSADHEPARSLYIHVPFCFHKCHYCDFYSFVDTQDRQGAFLEALRIELDGLATHAGAIRTIFVGGGTPSLLHPDLWRRLLGSLRDTFDLSTLDEFTVECNPETVTAELAQTLAAGGVNRVSMGAQSFEPRHLKTLERWHDPASVARALSIVADAGIRRRSIDLIYAIPGQTLDDWRRDLETALSLDPGVEHLSCYALTYEPNTAMTKRLELGRFVRTDEDLEADMFETTVSTLRAAGLDRYEVSNFARPGAECAHNMAYWRQESWLAAGPSASAHLRMRDPALGGWRWKNLPRLTDWMEGVTRNVGLPPVVDLEPPDPVRAHAERVMTGLRLREGIEASIVRTCPEGGSAIVREIGAGWLVERDGRLTLTDAGFLFADGVASRLMQAVQGG
ncbi:MAG: radical SAM family heme chaperone HemW [Phycisphaerales bacterium]